MAEGAISRKKFMMSKKELKEKAKTVWYIPLLDKLRDRSQDPGEVTGAEACNGAGTHGGAGSPWRI